MAKYGKRNEIDLNPLSYGISLLGESGVGKTTLIKSVCEKLAGEDGYLFLDIGKEDGCRAINGIVAETCEDWDKFEEVVDYIVDNRTSEYADLKVVVIDTIDQLFDLAEQEVIALHNRNNPDKRVDSINAAMGGYMKGQDKAVEIVLNKLWELKHVGVSFIIIGHVKNKDVTDIVSEESYKTLTSNLTQRYFNAIKTKVYFLGLAYVDREIIKEKTGKKNTVTKKDETKSVLKSEVRKINFRDDNFALDSKSRFADIVESIPLDPDAFIKAMQDAILAEHSKGSKTVEQSQKEQEDAEAKRLKDLVIAEEKAKKEKEFSGLVGKIKDYIRENKSEMNKLKPMLEEAKRLGYANPTVVDNIDDAKALLALAQ